MLEAVGPDANVVINWQPEPPADAEPTSPVVLKRTIHDFFMTKCDATSVQPPTSRHAAAEALVKSVVGKPVGKVLSRLAEREFSPIEESRLANAVAMAMNAENPFSAYAYVQSEALKAAAARIYAL